jgi:hypothetical protein
MNVAVPQVLLSERQQWAIVLAHDLENDGWTGAANHLRRKYFPHLKWDDPKAHVTAKGFEEMLRIHHGSLPPFHYET